MLEFQTSPADRSGARVAVIVGFNEVEAGTAVIRPLRGVDQQRPVARQHPHRRSDYRIGVSEVILELRLALELAVGEAKR